MKKGSESDREIYVELMGPEMEAAFPMSEYRRRLEVLRAAMQQENIDLVFLSSPESINWLTGYAAEWYQGQSSTKFQPMSGIAVHVNHERWIHFDTDMEPVLIRTTSVSEDVRLCPHENDGAEFIAKHLSTEGWLDKSTVGLELGSYRPNRVYSEHFQATLEQKCKSVSDATKLVRKVRRQKSQVELASVRTAQRIADIGMQAAIDTIEPGMTELEVYAEVIAAMARAGGENAGITLPVASGLKSTCVHALASRRVIMPGEIVNVDVCGVYNRYHANMARAFSMGEPDPEVAKRCEIAYGAMDLVEKTVRPGLPVKDLMQTVKEYYTEHGILDEAWWIGGYELGIAFPPDWVGEFMYELVGEDDGETFLAGDVCNYEANFYLPKSAGMVMAINTLLFGEASAGFLQRTPNQLFVIERDGASV